MRTIPSAVHDHFLARKPFFRADLFRFDLQNGNEYNYTSWDYPLTVGAEGVTTWTAADTALTTLYNANIPVIYADMSVSAPGNGSPPGMPCLQLSDTTSGVVGALSLDSLGTFTDGKIDFYFLSGNSVSAHQFRWRVSSVSHGSTPPTDLWTGYVIHLDPLDLNAIILGRVVAGVATNVGSHAIPSAEIPGDVSKFHKITIHQNGGNITVDYDDVPLSGMSYTDSSPLPAGKIELGAISSPTGFFIVLFLNVVLTAPGASGDDITRTYGSNIVISRNKITQKIGLETDTMRLTISAPQTELVEGVPFYKAVRQRIFDNCDVSLDIAIIDVDRRTVIGVIRNWFKGKMSNIEDANRESFVMVVKSNAEILNTPFPRNQYQSGCRNTLYDSVCQLTKASFAVTTTLGTVSADGLTITFTDSHAATYFSQGEINFTSGAAIGMNRTIKDDSAPVAGVKTIKLFDPILPTPSPGDTIVLYPGCFKRLNEDCNAKFNNVIHFWAEPFVPVPETVI